MKCFESPFTDPAMNLALEEYLFENSECDILIIWQNSPCVIIGKNQHAALEADLAAAEAMAVPVIRRSTGGGAVYQDLGNINFSLITAARDDDYGDFVAAMVRALKSAGVNAKFNGRNDICMNGFKISGSAAREEKGRTLCHCTMLIDADLGTMAALLTPSTAKLARNGVKSVESRVKNLCDMYPELDAEAVKTAVKGSFGANEAMSLTFEENSAIMAIAEKKYADHDWNYSVL